VWQEVPGEAAPTVRRLIVTQGDTGTGQRRAAGVSRQTAPSLYACATLQINCEEGRHLWPVYLRPRLFGRDGREEAEMLLERHSGTRQAAHPGAFNERRRHGCPSFMFTYFTDATASTSSPSLAESGFDPLRALVPLHADRGAHHMFVGESRASASSSALRSQKEAQDRRLAQPWGDRPGERSSGYLNFTFGVAQPVRQRLHHAANYYTMA